MAPAFFQVYLNKEIKNMHMHSGISDFNVETHSENLV